MDLRPYQAQGIEEIRAHFRAGVRKVLLHLATGGGKCLGRGTPVMLASGRVIPVENVKAGDELMGPDSLPRVVMSVSRGHGPLFRVTPVKGEQWICNDVHVLTLQHCQTESVLDIPLDEYQKRDKTFRHVYKQFRVPVDFPNSDPIDFDPYLAGLWLGDGSVNHACLTVATRKPAIKEYLLEYALRNGYTHRIDPGQGCEMIYLSQPVGSRKWYGNEFREKMKEFVGTDGQKLIPERYLLASRCDRSLLLAGIMDTDGCISKSGWDWISSSETLAKNLCFLARSLGLAAYLSPCKKGIKSIGFEGNYFRVSISGDCDKIPCLVNKPAPRMQKKSVLRTGISVSPIGDGDYFGFTLSGDGRFVLGDFTVTHNTHCFSYMMIQAEQNGWDCLLVVRGRKLVSQASKRLTKEGVYHGVLMAGHWLDRPSAKIRVASIDTLIARKMRPRARLIIIDEAHMAVSDGYKVFLTDPAYENSFIVAVTATPYSTKSMRHFADVIVHPITVRELMATGFLVDARYYAPSVPDTSGVKVSRSTGDYVTDELAAIMDKSAITGDIVTEWKKLAENRPSIIFAVNVEHSKNIAKSFTEAGIPVEHCDADTPEPEREAIIKRLEKGEIKGISNVGILCTGVDIPCVSCIVMARPTKSYPLYIQQAGRGTRPFPGKENFILLDHAGNVLRHGFITEEPEPDLDAKKKPMVCFRPKRCGACFAMVAEFPCQAELMRRDPEGNAFLQPCGWVPPVEERPERELVTVDGTLKELKGPSDLEVYETEEFCARELQKCVDKNRNVWSAYYKTSERFGEAAARMVFFRLCKKHGLSTERKKKEVTDGFPFK